MAAIMPAGTVPRSASNRELVSTNTDKTVELPELRNSDHAMDKNKPLPTSLQSDFIPEDILLAITHPPPTYNKLGPPSRYRNLNTTATPNKKAAANVWNYPNRREKYKHLTKNTPCVCGAGNDISFLYDVPKKADKPDKPSQYDTSGARALETETSETQKKPLALPDTLIPDEYHIVKNKGVMGLEYHEEKFATQPADHEQHLVQFPSMNPTSRFEVTQLKKTLNEMLDRAGIYEEEVELRGPTQMHNLLELIKKEQNIYNIVFHELIRQASVECLERGELLSELRDKYSTLLNKVPRQIKGLHEEVLAQRALDRRLTEELLRFKTTISALTSELVNVKEHDTEVSYQAKQAQQELKSALAESQKNAGLLAEYHELYELQRKRLEKQVDMLADEREIWSTVAYSLALKVMEEHSLNTSKRLHICEKSWSKLAHHFTVTLSDNDTVVLTSLQGYVDKWRDLVEEFNTNMLDREREMKSEMMEICTGLRSWAREFERHHLSAEGYLHKQPDIHKVTKLYNDLKAWEQTLEAFVTMAQESEKFGGDTVLTGQEYMTSIRQQMYGWTDSAMKIFSRHQTDDGKDHADQTDMITMNEEIELLLTQFNIRLTGENGVATGIIYINNCLEQWDGRFNSLLHGSNPLPDAEWLRFYQVLEEWAASLEGTSTLIGGTQKDEHRRDMLPHREASVPDIMRITHKWVSSTVNGIDSEDAKLVEAVGNLHTEQVKWMVQMLLRLAPDRTSHSDEAKEAVLLGSTTIGQLQSNAKSLFNRLTNFTKYVTKCCKTIVLEDMQQKIDQRQENADVEYKALNRLGMECNEWVEVAKMMLTELTGETFYDNSPMISFSEILTESKPSSAVKLTPDVAYHDKEKLQQDESDDLAVKEDGTKSEGAESHGASSNQQTETESTANQETETPTNQEPEKREGENQADKVSESPTNQKADTESETTNQEVEVVSPDADQREDAQNEEQPQNEVEEAAAPEPELEQIEVIGYDANTHKKVLDQQPDQAPPHDGSTVAQAPPSGGSTIAQPPPPPQGGSTVPAQSAPSTPDTKKAYEALAALETLQHQLISTEERAQGAESKVATMEMQLKAAEEKIRAMERQFGVQHEPIQEVPEPQVAPPVPATPAPAAEKVDKPKPKTKEKPAPSSRSSSRSSTKSKKK